MYKLPQIHDSPYEFVKDGHGYFYMDAGNMEWEFGKVPLNETKHALSFTLQQVYQNVNSQVRLRVRVCVFNVVMCIENQKMILESRNNDSQCNIVGPRLLFLQ